MHVEGSRAKPAPQVVGFNKKAQDGSQPIANVLMLVRSCHECDNLPSNPLGVDIHVFLQKLLIGDFFSYLLGLCLDNGLHHKTPPWPTNAKTSRHYLKLHLLEMVVESKYFLDFQSPGYGQQ